LIVERCWSLLIYFFGVGCCEIALKALGDRQGRGDRLPVDGKGPLLDRLDAGVDNGGLLDGVGSGDGSPGGEHVGAGGEGADDLGAGHDGGASGQTSVADDASLGGGNKGGKGSEEFHGDF